MISAFRAGLVTPNTSVLLGRGTVDEVPLIRNLEQGDGDRGWGQSLA